MSLPSIATFRFLGAVSLAGAYLRMYGLTSRSLWLDEAFTRRLMEFSLVDLIQRATEDNSPPFYYLVLHGWCGLFGDAMLSIRLLSVGCGVLSIPVAWRMAYEVQELERRTGHAFLANVKQLPMLFALLVSVSPFQIAMSAEARPYSLGVLLTLTSTMLLAHALQEGSGRSSVVFYALFSAALVLTHHFGWFLLLGHFVFALSLILHQHGFRIARSMKDPRVKRFLIAGLCVFAAYSAWLPTLLRQTQQVSTEFWMKTADVQEVCKVIWQMFVVPVVALEVSAIDAFTAGIAAIFMMVALVRHTAVSGGLVAAITSATFLGACSASVAISPMLNLRYFAFVHVIMLFGLSALVCALSVAAYRWMCGLGAVALGLICCGLYWSALDIRNDTDGFMEIARMLDQERDSQSAVIACTPYAFFPVVAHSAHPENIKLFVSTNVPHFHGAAALHSEEVCDTSVFDLHGGVTQSLWIVEMEDFVFDLPEGWQRQLVCVANDDFVPSRRLFLSKCIAMSHKEPAP